MNTIKRALGIISLFVCAYVLMGATTNAIYLHHERSTLANLEADLQNRELGLDPTDRTAVVRFSSGLYGHLISQEQPTVALTGTLGVTGATSLLSTLSVSGASSLAALSATTGSFSSTLGVTGASTLAALSATTGTFSGDLATAGFLSFYGNAASGAGRIFRTAANGLQLRAITGSSYDFGLENASGSNILLNPTGTTNILFPGANGVTITNNLTLSNLSSGRIPVVSTAGLITQDNLYWDATNDRLGIGSGASVPTLALDVSSSVVGNVNGVRLRNSDNTNSASSASLTIGTGGGSAGDASLIFDIASALSWSMGADNSDADAFVIAEGGTLGTSNRIRIASGGAVTIPGTLGVTGAATFTAAPVFSSATASQAVFTDGSKGLVSNALTGTGNVMMSASPTTTGTLTGAAANFSGAVSTGALASSSVTSTGTVTAPSATLGGGEAFTYGDTTFTMTATGMTTSPTGTAYATRIGNVVTIKIPYIAGTSNAVTFTLTGIPIAWRPSDDQAVSIGGAINNSGSTWTDIKALVRNTGIIELANNSDFNGWTSSGTKASGFSSALLNTFTYNLQ